MDVWQQSFFEQAPLFAPLKLHGADLATNDWPSLQQLQAALDVRGVCGGGGMALRVVVPSENRVDRFEQGYEPRVYLKGELVVRPCNWHDLFNVLVWLAFPAAKAAINARHYRALLARHQRSQANRGPTQDALTLFDEGGVIVASSDMDLFESLRAFEWKRLFWQKRQRVIDHMRWLLFGHAIYEKALTPFVGITGRGVLLAVAPDFHALPLQVQLAELDARLAALIGDAASFHATRELAPVPILGVPGWWPANSAEDFYDNVAYFRPGRLKRAARPPNRQ